MSNPHFLDWGEQKNLSMENALFQALIAATAALIIGLLIYGPKMINKKIHRARAGQGNLKSKLHVAKHHIEKKQYEQAIEHLESIKNENANLFEPYELLAYCYFAVAEYEKSKSHFLRLVKEDPKNADYNFFLGYCYYKTENLSNAKTYYERAIEIDRKYKKRKYSK